MPRDKKTFNKSIWCHSSTELLRFIDKWFCVRPTQIPSTENNRLIDANKLKIYRNANDNYEFDK